MYQVTKNYLSKNGNLSNNQKEIGDFGHHPKSVAWIAPIQSKNIDGFIYIWFFDFFPFRIFIAFGWYFYGIYGICLYDLYSVQQFRLLCVFFRQFLKCENHLKSSSVWKKLLKWVSERQIKVWPNSNTNYIWNKTIFRIGISNLESHLWWNQSICWKGKWNCILFPCKSLAFSFCVA